MWTPERFFKEHQVPENYAAQLDAVSRFVARHKDEGRRVVLVTVRLIFLYVLTRVAALLPRSSVMCESLLTACAIWTTFPRGPVARHPLNTFSRKDMR